MWGIVLNIPSARIMGTCYIRCGSQRKRNMKTHGVVYGLPFALLLLFIRSSCGDVGQLLPRKSFLEDFTKGQWISVPYPARVGTCSPQGWLNTSEVLKTLNIEEVTFVVKLKVLEGKTNIRNDTTFLVGVTSGDGVSRIFKTTGRWTNGSEYLTATKLIKLNSDGTKFGIRLLDGKYCVNVFAINISYNFCPKKLFKRNGNSVEFPRTYSPPDGSFPKTVEGTCKHSKGKPVAHCKSDGSWEFKDSMHYCDCTPGQIAVGKSECIDLENVVQDMKVIRQSNTRAALSWRSNVPSANYSVECGRCVLDNCTGVCSEITRIFWQKEQRIGVNITGLKQASYNITVVAWIRGVNGSRNKTAKKSIMLEELPRKVRNLNYSFQGHHNIVLSWQPPENAQPNGISYEVTCEASCNREVSSERCPELQYSPSPDNLLQTNVTITGFGQYGKRYCFTVYTKNRWYMSDDGRVEWNFGSIYFTAKSKEEIRDDSKGFNVVDVIIGVCVLIVAVIVSVIVTRCYNRWKARKHGVVFDAENPEQLYNGDVVPISMKATTSYVDPSNYESIKNVLRQFTKKLSERNLKTEEIIGEGEFGVVWKGYLDAPGQERITVAVKSLRSGLSAKLRRDFLAEASVMGQFKDPNVISLHGVVVKKNTVKIVMEYMENGSLDKYLERNNGRLTTLQLLGMARGIASGMKYLSGRNFIHRDLAARNILVDRNLCCKVSDFGLTREICETSNYETRGGKIPIRWTAPEVIKHKKSFIASDVWSYGVVLWEIMSFGQRPYWEWDNFQVLQEIETGYRLPAPLKCPKSVHCLMLQCWEKERTKRPLFSYIVDQLDEWIRSPETVNHSPAAVKRNKVEIVDSLSPIQQWLDSIKMGRYVSNFITAGYDSLSQVTHLTEEDLREMGITLVGHRHKIHQSIPLIAKST